MGLAHREDFKAPGVIVSADVEALRRVSASWFAQTLVRRGLCSAFLAADRNVTAQTKFRTLRSGESCESRSM